MKLSRVRRLVLVLMLLCTSFTYEAGVARTAVAPGDDNSGSGSGLPGGKWYSMGSIAEMKFCTTYEQTIVFFPPPPHYEIRMVQTQKDVWYLLERCFADNIVRECGSGSQRKTYQGGGC